MFCPKCGLEVKDGTGHCPRCGEVLATVKTTKRPGLLLPIALLGLGVILIFLSIVLLPVVVGGDFTIFDIGTY